MISHRSYGGLHLTGDSGKNTLRAGVGGGIHNWSGEVEAGRKGRLRELEEEAELGERQKGQRQAGSASGRATYLGVKQHNLPPMAIVIPTWIEATSTTGQ